MPNEPIHTALLVCERALTEGDGVISLIRVVDVFFVDDQPEVPIEKRPVSITVFFSARFQTEDDGKHSFELLMERPNGDVISVAGGTSEGYEKTRIPSAPVGLNLTLKFGVLPKVMGMHFFIAKLDGKEVQKTPFTLLPAEARKTGVPNQ
jgi:hypothetical protein